MTREVAREVTALVEFAYFTSWEAVEASVQHRAFQDAEWLWRMEGAAEQREWVAREGWLSLSRRHI